MAADIGRVTIENMPAVWALSYGERFRVRLCVRRGKAPEDRRLAAAAIELAELYQRMRYQAYVSGSLTVACGALTVWYATGGPTWLARITALAALSGLVSAAISPVFWPKKVARSLEASRAVVGSGE